METSDLVSEKQAPADDVRARQRWMAVLAKARFDDLEARWALVMPETEPRHTLLRAPETGMIMTQGRTGGTGQPFNLGEITVTRCTIRLAASGVVGHAWVAGRNRRHALLAALCDGLLQTDDERDEIMREIVMPLESAASARRHALERKAASTRVEFFTMVRGED